MITHVYFSFFKGRTLFSTRSLETISAVRCILTFNRGLRAKSTYFSACSLVALA